VVRARAAKRIPVPCPAPEIDPNLQLDVIFTNPEGTNGALKAANCFALDLDTRVVLLVPQAVPYPLPLEQPPVSVEFTERALSQLASQHELEVTIKVYLYRDRNASIRRALTPESFFVIDTQKRWWPNGEQMLARLLRRDGHNLILVDISQIQSSTASSAKVKSSL
jgi:hypothetical protein